MTGKKKRKGREPKWFRLLEPLDNHKLHTAGSIVRAGLIGGLLEKIDPLVPLDVKRVRARISLGRLTHNHHFPRVGDGNVTLRGQVTVPGWYGWRWKEAAGLVIKGPFLSRPGWPIQCGKATQLFPLWEAHRQFVVNAVLTDKEMMFWSCSGARNPVEANKEFNRMTEDRVYLVNHRREPIGITGFKRYQIEGRTEWEMFWRLQPKYRRRGLGTAITEALLKTAPADRFIVLVDPANQAAQKLTQKFFNLERTVIYQSSPLDLFVGHCPKIRKNQEV